MSGRHANIPTHELLVELSLRIGVAPPANTNEIIERLNFVNESLNTLFERLGTVMSAITDFATTVGTILTGVKTDVDNLKTQITTLTAAINALQNSPGTLGPDDQAALDAITKQANDLKADADGTVVPTAPPAPTA